MSDETATFEVPSNEEIDAKWRALTADGTLDGTVADANELCDEFFHKMRARYGLAPRSEKLFAAFREHAIGNVKCDVLTRARVSLLRRVD